MTAFLEALNSITLPGAIVCVAILWFAAHLIKG